MINEKTASNDITIIKILHSKDYDYQIYISTGEAFNFNMDDYPQSTLSEGQTLSPEMYDALVTADSLCRCAQKAVTYLSYSAMSKRKLYDKLVAASFDKQTAQAIADRFEQKHLIDDYDFALIKAQYMKETKNYGPARIKSDLISQYGVSGVTVREVMENDKMQDFDDNIRELVKKKFNRSQLNTQELRHRAAAALMRNGYTFEEAKKALIEYINNK